MFAIKTSEAISRARITPAKTKGRMKHLMKHLKDLLIFLLLIDIFFNFVFYIRAFCELIFQLFPSSLGIDNDLPRGEHSLLTDHTMLSEPSCKFCSTSCSSFLEQPCRSDTNSACSCSSKLHLFFEFSPYFFGYPELFAELVCFNLSSVDVPIDRHHIHTQFFCQLFCCIEVIHIMVSYARFSQCL